MTPAARLSAAIEVLDRILTGAAPEVVLTNWGRGNRFAGSGDRAAIRDLVYDCLRCKRSFAALGGGMTGRGLVLGGARAGGYEALFDGQGHAPAPVTPDDAGHAPEGLATLDCPDWLASELQAALGVDFPAVMQALRHRAPVFLRVNLARTTREAAMAALAEEGIVAVPHRLASSALEVTGNARKIQTGAAYAEGLVELQDAASQAVIEALPLRDGMRVLDYCAGGGGKTLAMAARAKLGLWAHDASPARMADLPARAKRAGAKVTITEDCAKTAPYDLILTDVPCSGSGSWRRDPQGKWALTAEKLAELTRVQAAILDKVAPMVAANGVLAYATCSMLGSENEAQVAAFLARTPGWTQIGTHRFSPLDGADGFFIAILTRKD
jgi:16S rRNA (cytosine967-C5)-methyltransferase